MAASTPGAGRAWSAPVATICLAGTAARSRTHHSWKCTERGPVPSVEDHVRLHPVVRHRQQDHPRSPAFAQPPGRLGQRGARVQHRGPGDVRGDVPVAQGEPVRPGAIGGQLGQHGERLVGPAPASLLADAPAQGVHHGVEVRADVQAEQDDVVAGVADHGDLGVGRGGLEAAQEAGGADAAGQNGDAHSGSLATPGRSRHTEPRRQRHRGLRSGRATCPEPRCTGGDRGVDSRCRAGKCRPDFPVIPAQQGGHYHVSRLTRGKTRACNFNGVILLGPGRGRRITGT